MKDSFIYGLHSVKSALEYTAERVIQAWIDINRQDRRLQEIYQKLQQQGIQFTSVSKRELDKLADKNTHQGVVIQIKPASINSEQLLYDNLPHIKGTPVLLVLEHIQDPHNLGACLRTADAAGVHGVIITKDQSTGITPTVFKVACGAADTVPIYQVTNLVRMIKNLKQQGFWVFGADSAAEQTVFQSDLTIPLVLVMGAEGKGLRRLTRENCDLLVKIPMVGSVASLNISVATGAILFEVMRQKTSM